MKQCSVCKKTFEDSMKFCQTDGTPLTTVVAEIIPPSTSNDPFKTVVAGSQRTQEDDILQLPIEHDPMKTMVASNIKKEIPLPPVSQPLNPPVFNEPLLSPPSFGDLSPVPPVKPIEVEPPTLIVPPGTPNFDATFTSMPLPNDSPFGSSPNKPSTSPFDQPMTNPFDTPSPSYTPPSFKEPDPIYTNEPFGNNPFDQPNQQMEQAWTPPPAPDQNWSNQGVGQNTPFQTLPISVGQGQNQTLAIVSLVLGILGVLLSFCCYGGIPFGIAALITGFLGMKNVNANPSMYGGKGLAIGGMITGAIGFLITIGIIILVVVLNVSLPTR